jgi:hypothetical protein
MAVKLRFRPYQPEDYDRLTDLYRTAMAHQQISVQRSRAQWVYLVQRMGIPLTVIENGESGAPIGYFWGRQKNGMLTVKENGVAELEKIPAILAMLKSEFPGEIQVYGNPADPLYQAVEALGGNAEPAYQWLINLPDPGKLITRIGLVLEQRLAAAGLNHLNTKLLINIYREAVRVEIKDGRLLRVENRGFVDASITATEPADLCIPPDAFNRLVFGYRGLTGLMDAWPDLLVLPQSRYVLEVLFPRLSSLILMPY